MTIQSKKNQGRLKKSITFFALLLVLAFLSRSTYNVYTKEKDSREALLEKNKEIESLTLREGELKRGLANLKTQDGMEFELRKKFGVVKNGEQVAIVVNTESTTSDEQSSKSIWQKIKSVFNF